MKKNEFLDALSHIDMDVLERYVNMDTALSSKPIRKKRTWVKKALLSAACVIIALTMLFVVTSRMTTYPPENPPENTTDSTTGGGDIVPDPPEVKLDMVNFFGGVLAIKNADGKSNPFEVEGDGRSEGSLGREQMAQSGFAQLSVTDKASVSVEREDIFVTDRAIYFKIIVDEGCDLLCDRFGAGVLDVVITNNNFGTIITFSDNKDYCSYIYEKSTEEDGVVLTDIFSTNGYVSGSEIVWGMSDVVQRFHIGYTYGEDESHIREIHFFWDVGDGAELYELEVLNQEISYTTVSYSLLVSQIMDYYYNVYNQGLPNGELRYAFRSKGEEEKLYIHIFTSGEFYICDSAYIADENDPFAFYLRGMNASLTDGHIMLQYTNESGEDVLVQAVRGSDGEFRVNEFLFEPYSITEDDAVNLPTLYFVSFGDDGEVHSYLRADTDGNFTAAKPEHLDPYFKSSDPKAVKGNWGRGENGIYFIYFHNNKKITIENVDFENGEAIVINNRSFTLCADPFPSDEVMESYLTAFGEKMGITRDHHYKVVDESERECESGSLRFYANRGGVAFYPNEDETHGYLGLNCADGSILCGERIFYPENHLLFVHPEILRDDDIVLRYDGTTEDGESLSFYLHRDGTFFVWSNTGGDVLFGKSVAVFEDNGIRLSGFGEYEGRSEYFGAWVDDECKEMLLMNVSFKLVYDLRS